jgi:hypothetical protein
MKYKTQAVQLSGVVYMKDPGDRETIQKLEETIATLRANTRKMVTKEEIKKIRARIMEVRRKDIERMNEVMNLHKDALELIATDMQQIKKIKAQKVSQLMGGPRYIRASYKPDLEKKINRRIRSIINEAKKEKY